MKCSNCGQQIPDESQFCEHCGEPVVADMENIDQEDEQQELFEVKNEGAALGGQEPVQLSPGVTRGTDGVIRWAYDMNMWKNPTILITVWKVLMLAALAPALLVSALAIGDGVVEALGAFVKVALYTAGIVTGLMVIAYPIVAIANGGKYCVVFEMDSFGVKHIQMQKQYERSQVLSMLTVLAGVAGGNIQATASGLLAGSKQSSYSKFSKVKSVVVHAKRNVIYVNENLEHNQVYASREDFEAVLEHILGKCKKAKVTYKSTL